MSILADDSWIFSPTKDGAAPRNFAEGRSTQCSGCSNTFTMIIRKHHCKRCGNIFCGKCSATVSSTDLYSSEVATGKIRVCSGCSAKMLLVRRKTKATRKATKSIVTKSLTYGKHEGWDENIFVDSNNKSTPAELGPCPAEVDLPTKSCGDFEKSVETDSLLPGSPSRHQEYRAEDEDDVVDRGILCIVPPSLYNFIFGD